MNFAYNNLRAGPLLEENQQLRESVIDISHDFGMTQGRLTSLVAV